AIDDFRLVRMQRQSILSKPRLKSGPQRHGLVFSTTMTNRIIGIAFEQYVREMPAHPQIERIVKKEIGQEGAYDPAWTRNRFQHRTAAGKAKARLSARSRRIEIL